MQWWQSALLGLVEGVTEYLPVSSTGHLLLTQRLLGLEQNDANDAFAICIQAGAIVAVFGLYFGRIREMAFGVAGKNPAGFRLALNIVAAFLPAAICGLLLEKPVKKYLFGGETWGLWPVVAAWFVGGVAILAVGWWKSRGTSARAHRAFELTELTWKAALVIGLIQCIAMWPGVSRSLVTIVGGLIVGLSLPAAVEFSFLLGLVTLGAATAYDGLKHGREMLESFGPLSLAVGFLAAWLSAVLAVKWMVGYLKRHGMQVFGYYRIGIAVVVAGMLWAGWLGK